MRTDWEALARSLGTIDTNGNQSGSSDLSRKALETILGSDWIKMAVEKAISFELGSEMAMNCLRYLNSEMAADYAYNIYKTDTNTEKRNAAVWLIKHLSVKKSFQWVEEFINDLEVIGWGIGVLDQLIWNETIDYTDNKVRIDKLLDRVIENSKGELKQNVDFIYEYLNARQD